MNCREFQERISPAVDEVLQKTEMASFVEHAQVCPGCRYEYETESLTKAFVRSRAKMVRAPGALIQRISEQLEHERGGPALLSNPWWHQIFVVPYAKPAFAIVLACIALVLLLKLPQEKAGPESAMVGLSNNVITQSLANHKAVVRGEIRPQHVSSNPDYLGSFFAGKTDFPVLIPVLTGCTLVGGVLNQHAGTTLAHVVYAREGEIIYMYEACWETVMKGQTLDLPQHAKDGLAHTGWFSETQSDGRTVVVWAKGNTLCAAVSNMNKEDLLRCLLSGDRMGRDRW